MSHKARDVYFSGNQLGARVRFSIRWTLQRASVPSTLLATHTAFGIHRAIHMLN